MVRGSYWWCLLASSFSCVLALYIFYVVWFATADFGGDGYIQSTLQLNLFGARLPLAENTNSISSQCVWKESDPVLYNMKTKMGVNYDAGHWFHMSENFMVQHSVLRKTGHLTNATHVIYNFDKRT
jgi:hypothetical protein